MISKLVAVSDCKLCIYFIAIYWPVLNTNHSWGKKIVILIKESGKNANEGRRDQFCQDLLHHLMEDRIACLHQQLRLLVIVKDPPFLALHQILGEHARQPVLLHLGNVVFIASKWCNFLFLDDNPAIGRGDLKKSFLGALYTFLCYFKCTLVYYRDFMWSK